MKILVSCQLMSALQFKPGTPVLENFHLFVELLAIHAGGCGLGYLARLFFGKNFFEEVIFHFFSFYDSLDKLRHLRRLSVPKSFKAVAERIQCSRNR